MHLKSAEIGLKIGRKMTFSYVFAYCERNSKDFDLRFFANGPLIIGEAFY